MMVDKFIVHSYEPLSPSHPCSKLQCFVPLFLVSRKEMSLGTGLCCKPRRDAHSAFSYAISVNMEYYTPEKKTHLTGGQQWKTIHFSFPSHTWAVSWLFLFTLLFTLLSPPIINKFCYFIAPGGFLVSPLAQFSALHPRWPFAHLHCSAIV